MQNNASWTPTHHSTQQTDLTPTRPPLKAQLRVWGWRSQAWQSRIPLTRNRTKLKILCSTLRLMARRLSCLRSVCQVSRAEARSSPKRSAACTHQNNFRLTGKQQLNTDMEEHTRLSIRRFGSVWFPCRHSRFRLMLPSLFYDRLDAWPLHHRQIRPENNTNKASRGIRGAWRSRTDEPKINNKKKAVFTFSSDPPRCSA